MTRKEYAEQVREKSIEQLIEHGYTREKSEQVFDTVTEWYRKTYGQKDEYSAVIRHGNESLYGCGMRDEILNVNSKEEKNE